MLPHWLLAEWLDILQALNHTLVELVVHTGAHPGSKHNVDAGFLGTSFRPIISVSWYLTKTHG